MRNEMIPSFARGKMPSTTVSRFGWSGFPLEIATEARRGFGPVPKLPPRRGRFSSQAARKAFAA